MEEEGTDQPADRVEQGEGLEQKKKKKKGAHDACLMESGVWSLEAK